MIQGKKNTGSFEPVFMLVSANYLEMTRIRPAACSARKLFTSALTRMAGHFAKLVAVTPFVIVPEARAVRSADSRVSGEQSERGNMADNRRSAK